jgi:hypothetical protein
MREVEHLGGFEDDSEFKGDKPVDAAEGNERWS